jgi:hypothetical protein
VRRGTFYCEPEGGEPFWWPYCEVDGCPNGICWGRSDRFCWPHGPGDLSVSEMIETARSHETTQKRAESA